MKTNYSNLLSKTTLALCGLMMTAPHVGANQESSLNRADEKFIITAASHDMEEVKLAELAVRKAVNPEVKAYAESIVKDHQESDKDLVNLAGSKRVDLSAEIKTEPSRTYRNLEKTDREDFDREFLNQMLDAHEKNVSHYEDAYEDTEDAEVKVFATERLPALKARHQELKELRNREIERTTDPDNTKRNVRDRDDKELTSFDQGSSRSDREITANIRKSILDVDNMSTNGKNVKIITKEGMVTLRGPVNSAAEKNRIDEIARRTVNANRVDSRLEVKTDNH